MRGDCREFVETAEPKNSYHGNRNRRYSEIVKSGISAGPALDGKKPFCSCERQRVVAASPLAGARSYKIVVS
jgi:hypothetical protein